GIGGSLQNGFHVTVISSPSPDFINRSWFERYEEPLPNRTVTFIWSSIVGLYGVGGLIGSMCVKYFAGRFGRKGAMMWNDAISIVSALIMFSSKSLNSFEMVILARFSYGFAAGLGLFVHMMYLGESSPTKLRGMVTLTSATFFAIGKLSGQLAGLKEFLGHESLWNVLLSLPGILAFIQLVALLFIPEAPRYLLIDKDNKEMCQKALQTLWGVGEYKVEMEEMMLEQVAIKGQPSKSVVGLMRDHLVRWQLLTIMVITFSIQFSGVSAISSFSYSVLMEAGIPSDKIRYVTLGLGISEVMTSIVCGFLIEDLGRRSLLWKGFGVMSVLMALVGLTQLLKVSFLDLGPIICSKGIPWLGCQSITGHIYTMGYLEMPVNCLSLDWQRKPTAHANCTHEERRQAVKLGGVRQQCYLLSRCTAVHPYV
uniref:Solute carrier family 2 member 9, like 1 n=1 Tax=Paramormyrops kingsleyae TaxID=1676925 RepID=A0A3B3RI80_9TELE